MFVCNFQVIQNLSSYMGELFNGDSYVDKLPIILDTLVFHWPSLYRKRWKVGGSR